LSLALFFCDRGLNCFTTLRTAIPFIIIPLQQVTNWPIDSLHIFLDNLASRRDLLQENNRLRAELLLAEAQLQRLYFLEQENSQLHVLLGSVKTLKSQFLTAQLLTLIVDS
jgi:rod shape-determining protein MreC